MTKHFFITGLVRCRSAWLSNLLTWGSTFCWHDVFFGLKSDKEFASKMDRYSFVPHMIQTIGIADPALTQCWRSLVSQFPEAKWVVVQRDMEDAFRSATHSFESVSRDGITTQRNDLSALCAAVQPKVIRFDDLGDVEKCYELARHLEVAIGPIQRVQQLCEMNVQIHPPILKRRLESLKCQHHVDTKEAA